MRFRLSLSRMIIVFGLGAVSLMAISCKRDEAPSTSTRPTPPDPPKPAAHAITLGLVAHPGALPLVLAEVQGAFEKHLVDAHFRFFESTEAVARELASGGVDAGMLSPGEALKPRETGAFTLLQVLSRNAGSLTVSRPLWNAIQPHLLRKAGGEPVHPIHANTLALVAQRVTRERAPIAFQIDAPLATDAFLLRYWLKAAGITSGDESLFHPSIRFARIQLLTENDAPSSPHRGHAGSPWDKPDGQVTLIDSEAIVRDVPDTVLAVRAAWLATHRESAIGTVAGALKAAQWLEESADHRTEALETFLETAADALSAEQRQHIQTVGLESGSSATFSKNASAAPDRTSALWIVAQMVQWGHLPATMTDSDLGRMVDETLDREVFVEATKRAASYPAGLRSRLEEERPIEAVLDGRHFRPATPTAFIQRPRPAADSNFD